VRPARASQACELRVLTYSPAFRSADEEEENPQGTETRAAIANAFLAEPQEKQARVGTVTWMSQRLLPIWDSRTVVAGAYLVGRLVF
jgi:hypothetical protein